MMILKRIELNRGQFELNHGQYLLCGGKEETKDLLWSVIDETLKEALIFIREEKDAAKIFLTENNNEWATNLLRAEYLEELNLIMLELNEDLNRMLRIRKKVLQILEKQIKLLSKNV